MIRPLMGLRSGGDLVAVAGHCGGGAVLEVPLEGGGGGGGGHTADPVSGECWLASLAPVGRPRGLI
jgi:hypothetical protein